jgi:hypothetical protein
LLVATTADSTPCSSRPVVSSSSHLDQRLPLRALLLRSKANHCGCSKRIGLQVPVASNFSLGQIMMDIKHPAVSLYALLFVAFLVATCMAAPTSRIPVRLDLKRLSASGNAASSSLREAKTQPAFFKDVLGLRSGEPFDFNLERWKALGRCGLFRNLTARTVMGQDGVYLNITGFEVPSTSFAPEVTAVASLDNPEVLGGVTWKDSNFRGMGEYLSFSVMKKEGIEEGVQDLDPTIAVRWVDRTVGRDSQISFNFEKENLIESNINLVTNAVHRVYSSLAGGDSWVQRVPVQCTAVGVQLQR